MCSGDPGIFFRAGAEDQAESAATRDGPGAGEGKGSDGRLEPGSFPGPLCRCQGQPESRHYLTDFGSVREQLSQLGRHGDAVRSPRGARFAD